MTDTPGHYNGGTPSRLDRIEATLQQLSDRVRAIARPILSDNWMILFKLLIQSWLAVLFWMMYYLSYAIAMKKNQRNFEEYQRTTNAVMQSLEAIWLRFSR